MDNPIFWFFNFLNDLRVNVLEKFIIPGLGVSYWQFVIGVAICAVVITVLVSVVRIGTVSRFSSNKGDNARPDNSLHYMGNGKPPSRW